MKTKNIPAKKAAGKLRKQVLILVPSIPSPQASRSQKTAHDTLTFVSADHEVLCLPEDKPLSARLDEAALASRGVSIYSFPPVTREDVSKRLKTLITANPGLGIIGFVGLEAMRRHLVDARLFAPAKSFFAVLSREDAAALGGRAAKTSAAEELLPDGDRDLLSCCDAVFCEDGKDAEFLRRFFAVDAGRLASISRTLSALDSGTRSGSVKLGVISRAPLRPAPDLRGAFKASRKMTLRKNGPDFAGINRLLLGASHDIPAWAVISRPFSACETLWPRIGNVFRTFPNAGLVLPAPVVCGLPVSGVVLEAASLNRQGRHSEPVLVDDLPLVVLRAEAFRKVGGFDARFASPGCAWTDLGLRMKQAGFRVITAEDAVVSSRPPAAGPGELDIDLLVRKWCAEGLRVMELLLFELGGRQP